MLRTAAAGPGLTLRWHRNGQPLSDDERRSGTGSATLTIRQCGAGDIGEYTCVASLEGLALSTLPAELNVTLRPVITSLLPPAARAKAASHTSGWTLTAARSRL